VKYHQIAKNTLPEIIDILSLIKADNIFDDTNIMLRLQEIITKIRHYSQTEPIYKMRRALVSLRATGHIASKVYFRGSGRLFVDLK